MWQKVPTSWTNPEQKTQNAWVLWEKYSRTTSASLKYQYQIKLSSKTWNEMLISFGAKTLYRHKFRELCGTGIYEYLWKKNLLPVSWTIAKKFTTRWKVQSYSERMLEMFAIKNFSQNFSLHWISYYLYKLTCRISKESVNNFYVKPW